MSAASSNEREAWIDTARGIAIVMVVLFHSVLYLSEIDLAGPWSKLASTLDTFRMPLFFFIAGMLARRILSLRIVDVLRFRALNFMYLYVLWSVLLVALVSVLADQPDLRAARWSTVTSILTRPNSNLWFLYGLSIFFVVGWLMRRWPVWVQIAVPAVVSVLFASGILHTGTPWDKTGRYWVFFVLACHAGPWVRRVAPRLRAVHMLVFGGAYIALLVVLVLHGLDRILFVRLALGVLAIATGSAAAVVLSRHRASRGLQTLGARTLPIYLVHTFPMVAVAALLPVVGGGVRQTLALVAVPALTAASITLALLLHRLLDERVPGLFRFPVRTWITPAARRPIDDGVRPLQQNRVE